MIAFVRGLNEAQPSSREHSTREAFGHPEIKSGPEAAVHLVALGVRESPVEPLRYRDTDLGVLGGVCKKIN